MFDQLAAKIVGLEIVVGTEGVDNPHLVASAAGGDVEALLEQFLIAKRERAALSGVNQRNKDDVAFVALELSGVTAEEAMEFVAVGREMGAKKVVNLDGLFIADQRNHRIRRVDRATGVITTVAGNPAYSCSQPRDGESATNAGLCAALTASEAGASVVVNYASSKRERRARTHVARLEQS